MSGTGDMRVGFIGLGRMGYPMASNVAVAGFPLTVWNRTVAKAEALAAETGASVAASPADLARGVDVVITMVADGEVLSDLYTGFRRDVRVARRRDALRGHEHGEPGGVAPGGRGGRGCGREVRRCAGLGQHRHSHRRDPHHHGRWGSPVTWRPWARCSEAMGSRGLPHGVRWVPGRPSSWRSTRSSTVSGRRSPRRWSWPRRPASGARPPTRCSPTAPSPRPSSTTAGRPSSSRGQVPVAFRMVLAKKDLDLALDLARSAGASMPQADPQPFRVGGGHLRRVRRPRHVSGRGVPACGPERSRVEAPAWTRENPYR